MPAPPQPLLLLFRRPWKGDLAKRLSTALERPVHTIGKPAELQLESLEALDPEWIFVPHWSQWIPETNWSRWPTVIFHMITTDDQVGSVTALVKLGSRF